MNDKEFSNLMYDRFTLALVNAVLHSNQKHSSFAITYAGFMISRENSFVDGSNPSKQCMLYAVGFTSGLVLPFVSVRAQMWFG